MGPFIDEDQARYVYNLRKDLRGKREARRIPPPPPTGLDTWFRKSS